MMNEIQPKWKFQNIAPLSNSTTAFKSGLNQLLSYRIHRCVAKYGVSYTAELPCINHAANLFKNAIIKKK